MNDTFSFSRLWALIVRYWAEWKWVNGLYWLLAVAALLWVFVHKFSDVGVFMKSGNSGVDFLMYYLLFMFIQFLLVFQEFIHQKRAAFLTVLPALQREKFVSLIANAIVFPTIFYWLALSAVGFFVSKWYAIEPMQMTWFVNGLYNDDVKYVLLVSLYSLLAVFLGHFIFRKKPLLYSVFLLVMAVMYLLMFINFKLIELYIAADRFSSSPFGDASLLTEPNNTHLLIDNGLIFDFAPYSIPLVGLFFVGMLYTAYLKMKERQVKV